MKLTEVQRVAVPVAVREATVDASTAGGISDDGSVVPDGRDYARVRIIRLHTSGR